MRSMQEAWSMLAANRGSAVQRGGRRTNGLAGINSGPTDVGGSCVVAQQWDKGYWPYPWSEMPPGGLPFDEFQSIVTPAANGTETVVLQFQVPFGYDGIVLGVMNIFTGPGFVEGSGSLTWRIRVGQPSLQGRPQLNYSNIINTMGSLSQPREVHGGIQIISGQFLEYSVTHALLSPIVPAGTRIVCNIAGYYWPRGASPIASGGAQ